MSGVSPLVSVRWADDALGVVVHVQVLRASSACFDECGATACHVLEIVKGDERAESLGTFHAGICGQVELLALCRGDVVEHEDAVTPIS